MEFSPGASTGTQRSLRDLPPRSHKVFLYKVPIARCQDTDGCSTNQIRLNLMYTFNVKNNNNNHKDEFHFGL